MQNDPGKRKTKFTQRALAFFKGIRALDPTKAKLFKFDFNELCEAIPLLTQEMSDEYSSYMLYSKEVQEGTEALVFWQAMQSKLPQLSKVARFYLSVPMGSVDAERSFSARGNLLTDKRLALTRQNRTKLHFISFNTHL